MNTLLILLASVMWECHYEHTTTGETHVSLRQTADKYPTDREWWSIGRLGDDWRIVSARRLSDKEAKRLTIHQEITRLQDELSKLRAEAAKLEDDPIPPPLPEWQQEPIAVPRAEPEQTNDLPRDPGWYTGAIAG